MSKYVKNQAFVSAHFQVSEWEGVAQYPVAWLEDRLVPLARALERIREHFDGASITIGAAGGYRPPAANAKIGGAKKSQHLEGRAADIRVKGVSAKAVYAAAKAMYTRRVIDIGGLGYYPELPVSTKDPRGRRAFVHIDVRPHAPGARLVTWTGRRE